MVIVGPKPVPYIAPPKPPPPKPPTDEDDDDVPWLENGCLDSRWIKSSSSTTTATERKKKFRDAFSFITQSDSMAYRGTYDFQQLKDATRNFHSDNKIGEGGFGRVYKGKLLKSGLEIAVKQPVSNSKEGKQMFKNELAIATGLDHPNLVKLLGSCWENNQILLVYEYMENNSLFTAFFGAGKSNLKSRLNWQARLQICLGIAKGLAFLHEESIDHSNETKLRIIHGNIKPTNILLDKDLNAKLSGFGLAKHHEEKHALSTKVGGTSCYSAPEYAMHGLLTYKSDVYNFGVVMLEILSGKSITDCTQNDEIAYLLDRAYVLEENGRLSDLLDRDLKMDYNGISQVERALNLAMLCTKQTSAVRPKMSEVVSILEGKTALKTVSKRPKVVPSDSDDSFWKASLRKTTSFELKTRPNNMISQMQLNGFVKASASAEKSDALHETCSKYDTTDANHDKEPLVGDDHPDIQEYDFEDADSTMQLHDHHSLTDDDEEEEEEEEDNIAGGPNDFDGGISSSKVNVDQSIGDQTIEGGQKDDAKLLMERNFPVMSGPSESSNARKSWSSTTTLFTIEGGQKDDAKLLMERNFPVMSGPSESSNARKSWSSTTTLFTDHNATKMNLEEDKSELEYVEPTFDEDGKLRIEYLEKEFEEGCNEWKDSLVGFFVGDDKPLIMNTILNKENVETLWGVKGDDAVSFFSMEDGYFLIQFKYTEDKIKVLQSGPWHIENRPLILREWNWKLKFDKANEIKTLPIWVKIYNLPLFLWTSSYLSKVGSALGTPLYSDQRTKNKERLDFARLCIQVDASKSLPNSLNISIKGVDYGIRFEYEWKPLRCAKMEDMKQN